MIDTAKINGIAIQMARTGLPEAFVRTATATALADESGGIAGLFGDWADETDQARRDEYVADIQELIEDVTKAPLTRVYKPMINCRDRG